MDRKPNIYGLRTEYILRLRGVAYGVCYTSHSPLIRIYALPQGSCGGFGKKKIYVKWGNMQNGGSKYSSVLYYTYTHAHTHTHTHRCLISCILGILIVPRICLIRSPRQWGQNNLIPETPGIKGLLSLSLSLSPSLNMCVCVCERERESS